MTSSASTDTTKRKTPIVHQLLSGRRNSRRRRTLSSSTGGNDAVTTSILPSSSSNKIRRRGAPSKSNTGTGERMHQYQPPATTAASLPPGPVQDITDLRKRDTTSSTTTSIAAITAKTNNNKPPKQSSRRDIIRNRYHQYYLNHQKEMIQQTASIQQLRNNQHETANGEDDDDNDHDDDDDDDDHQSTNVDTTTGLKNNNTSANNSVNTDMNNINLVTSTTTSCSTSNKLAPPNPLMENNLIRSLTKQHLQETTTTTIHPIMLLGICSLTFMIMYIQKEIEIQTLQQSTIFQQILEKIQQREQQYQLYIKQEHNKYNRIKYRLIHYHDWVCQEKQRGIFPSDATFDDIDDNDHQRMKPKKGSNNNSRRSLDNHTKEMNIIDSNIGQQSKVTYQEHNVPNNHSSSSSSSTIDLPSKQLVIKGKENSPKRQQIDDDPGTKNDQKDDNNENNNMDHFSNVDEDDMEEIGEDEDIVVDKDTIDNDTNGGGNDKNNDYRSDNDNNSVEKDYDDDDDDDDMDIPLEDLPSESMPTSIYFQQYSSESNKHSDDDDDGQKRHREMEATDSKNNNRKKSAHSEQQSEPCNEEVLQSDPNCHKENVCMDKIGGLLDKRRNVANDSSTKDKDMLPDKETRSSFKEQEMCDENDDITILPWSTNHSKNNQSMAPPEHSPRPFDNLISDAATRTKPSIIPKQRVRTSAFHPMNQFKRKTSNNYNNYLDQGQQAKNQQSFFETTATTKPNDVVPSKPGISHRRNQLPIQNPRPKRRHMEMDHNDDDNQSMATMQSEMLVSQLHGGRPTAPPPQKTRRITASPRILPGRKHHQQTLSTPKDNPYDGHTIKNKSGRKTKTTLSGHWISNEPARKFVRDIPTSNKQQQSTASHNNKENKVQPSTPTFIPARPTDSSLVHGANSTQSKSALQNNKPIVSAREQLHNHHHQSASKNNNRSKDLMSDSSDDDDDDDNDTPDYKYQEVVRKKSDRETLNQYDCIDCAAFVDQVILQGNGANVYNRDELIRCSRHRSRHTPPSTPPDFWELSFIDEQKERQQQQQQQQEESA